MNNKPRASVALIILIIASAMLAGHAQARAITGPTEIAGMRTNVDIGMMNPQGFAETAEISASASGSGGESAFTYGIPSGDLNSDGNDDVLVVNGTYDSTTDIMGTYTYGHVSAVNGHDGTEIWGMNIVSEAGGMIVAGDAPVHPVGDLNGDGNDDVLLITTSRDSGTDAVTVTASARHGNTGIEIWSQSVTGDSGFLYGTSIQPPVHCDLDYDGNNDVLLVTTICDSTTGEITATLYAKKGDTGVDFWSESVTGTGMGVWVSVYSQCNLDSDSGDDVIMESRVFGSDTMEATATVRAKNGDTGVDFWSESMTGEGVSISAYPYCDLDGDGKNDVIVELRDHILETDNATTTVHAKKGDTGVDFWSESFTGGNILLVSYTYCDLDGDGKDDVILIPGIGMHDSGGEGTATVHAKKGDTGVDLWSESVTGENVSVWAFSCCDLNGDGKSDVVMESVCRNSTTNEITATVSAKHGDTGVDFWSESMTGADMLLWVYPYCDLNGDGKGDVIMQSERHNPDTSETTSIISAKRGDTGVDFWSESMTGVNATLAAYAYCDLSGDGKDDVIVESKSPDSGGEITATVSARNGDSGTELWSRSVTGDGAWMESHHYHYWANQDLDGDDLNDLILTTGTSVDMCMYGFCFGAIELPTGVCAVKGVSGVSFWCEPQSTSTDPEPPTTGDLSGDGEITPADAAIALAISMSGDYNEDADVNGDGALDSLDALLILQAAAGVIAL